jgi:hypothetical protein
LGALSPRAPKEDARGEGGRQLRARDRAKQQAEVSSPASLAIPDHLDVPDDGGQEKAKANGASGQQSANARPFVSAADFVNNYVPPAYLVDGIVQKSRFYSLTAKTCHGKTAVGLCCAVAKAGGTSLG